MKYLYIKLTGSKGSTKIIEDMADFRSAVLNPSIIERAQKWALTAIPGDVFFLTGGHIACVNDSVEDLRPM